MMHQASNKPEINEFKFKCPCCRMPVDIPDVDMIVDNLSIPPQQAIVLRTIANGKGYPIPVLRILDQMWANDPDGGPNEDTQRKYFKVALSLLRKKLEGTGVSIERIEPQRGYRFMIKGK